MDKDTMKLLLEQISKTTADTQSGIKEMRNEFKEMRSEFADMRVTQGEQKQILDEHIRRTEQNEQMIQKNKEETDERFDKITVEIAPLKTHVAMWNGVSKALVVIGILAGIAGAVAKYLM